MITEVYKGEAEWGRLAYLKLVDQNVIFDCSDGEYGPIEFNINLLNEALGKHRYAIPQDEWNRRRDRLADQYQELERAIIDWSNAGTRTAGELTRQIVDILNRK